ncbi:hypothetical protein B0T20DRAFT_403962 [Sordaria brevicollis]|uniref:VHS domain-containing protein n=1 Tax=Sordaria brevicollis TaxID=83679 RepID=A0AAE0PLW6_SORBR|nr:hypothetical protein B0T20DRAFT_403962 [Sordaria brevicollis]
MFSSYSSKPYTAVSVDIERLTSETYPEDDLSGIPELIEAINLQATGPTEAARAIRKKLKYGNLHRQLRALTILDALIQNAGARFQRTFADEPLLERLRFCGTAELSDPLVKKKCSEMFRSWTAYKSTPGMERVANLYRELPRRKQVVTQERSKVLKETENPFGEDEEEERPAPASTSTAQSSSSTAQPSSSSSRRPTVSSSSGHAHSSSRSSNKDKSKKSSKSRKHRPFNLEAEKDQMTKTIAEASIASTNLMNTLQSINREKERISENSTAVERFEKCKKLRRNILRYIQHVESEQWLGGLLHANDELVQALMTFEQLDRSIDADSDSDDDLAEQAHLYRMATEKAAKAKESGGSVPGSPRAPTAGMAGLSITNTPASPPPMPPRPAPPPRPSAASKPSMLKPPTRRIEPSDDEDSDVDEDENDPFADRNAVSTPKVESDEPKWS